MKNLLTTEKSSVAADIVKSLGNFKKHVLHPSKHSKPRRSADFRFNSVSLAH